MLGCEPLNLMTAGAGVAHSEEATGAYRGWPLRAGFEHALLVLEGAIVVDGQRVEAHQLAYLGMGRETVTLSASGQARLRGRLARRLRGRLCAHSLGNGGGQHNSCAAHETWRPHGEAQWLNRREV